VAGVQAVNEPWRVLGRQLAALRRASGHNQHQFAALVHYARSTIANVEVGRQHAPREFWVRCDAVLETGDTLASAWDEIEGLEQAQRRAADRLLLPADSLIENVSANSDDELAALELVQRVSASDIGDETLARWERVVDELAMRYSVTPPAELLRRTRRYLRYVLKLVDARKTLDEHRRLLIVGAWLSLLAATLHIDLKQRAAATARLTTAAKLAQQTGHAEIYAWCFETEAWSMLTDGDYRRALELSQAAQRFAPKGSSIAIQSAAQEGRAWARIGDSRETYKSIDRVAELVSPLPKPDQPEHHYRYDPNKAVAYVATTLAWLGDSAAEPYAREVIARLSAAELNGKWPRRIAAAQLDLGLALLAANKFDEACAAARSAITSGRVVPSNHWRALEVVRAVETRGLPEGKDLREAYETLRRGWTMSVGGSLTGEREP
jgi:tetratricopeptide (TPR) repeat protein